MYMYLKKKKKWIRYESTQHKIIIIIIIQRVDQLQICITVSRYFRSIKHN